MIKNRFLFLTLQHLRRHWRLNLLVLAAMLMGAGLLAALPMVTAVIAGQSLQQKLDDALAPVSNIQVESDSQAVRLSPEHATVIQAEIGPFITQIVEVRDAILNAEQSIYRADGSQTRLLQFFRVRFWSFSGLAEHAQLIEGRWPSSELSENDTLQTVIEVAIGAEAADSLGISIGDELAVDTPDIPLNDPQGRFRIRIVGVVTPNNPDAPIWWDDPQMIPFSLIQEPITINLDQITISVFMPPAAMEAQLPEQRHYWRVLTQSDTITIATVSEFRQKVLNLVLQLGTMSARTHSGLPDLIAEYEAQLAQAQISLLLLSAQSLLAVLYLLGLISAFLLEQSQPELAVLTGRGFGRGQISRIFGIEAALLAFGLALPLGPLLVLAGFQLWSRWTKVTVMDTVPAISWQLAAAAVAFGWLALMIPLHLAARRQMTDWLRHRARPTPPTRWRRLTLDFFLLALGSLAYWQLTQIGTAARSQGNSITADPVLLLGPSLLTVAIGLLLLRLFPPFIQLIAWLGQRAVGIVLPTALSRLARDPVLPSQLILLISLSAGLTLFANVFSYSITQRQAAVARYSVGGDITLRQPRSLEMAANDAAMVELIPGVTAVTQIYRGQARPKSNAFSSVNFLAIDPDSLPRVATYPTGISQVPISRVASVLQQTQSGDKDVLPMILSSDWGQGGLQVGNQLDFHIGPETVTFEITGLIGQFPTVSAPFLITNLPQLNQQINLNSALLRVMGERELWLAAEPALHHQLVEQFENQTREEVGLASYQAGRLISSQQAQLAAFRANPTSRLATTAFSLNAIVLLILGGSAFLAVQLFSAKRRLGEFSVLQAIGLSRRQLIHLLGLEGVIVLSLGLTTGGGLGYGLALLMRPFLSLTLRQSLGGESIDQLWLNWFQIGWQYFLLTLVLGAGLAVVIVWLSRTQLHKALRLGEE